jgi:hypothetical protein
VYLIFLTYLFALLIPFFRRDRTALEFVDETGLYGMIDQEFTVGAVGG